MIVNSTLYCTVMMSITNFFTMYRHKSESNVSSTVICTCPALLYSAVFINGFPFILNLVKQIVIVEQNTNIWFETKVQNVKRNDNNLI